MTKIKICGITNIEDARLAVRRGANYLGFIFYPKSPRYVKPEVARDIIKQIPKRIKTVGVFVNSKEKRIKEVARLTKIKMLQLHGDESARLCSKFKIPIIKALRIKNKSDINKVRKYCTEFFLLDSYSPHKFGGTGKTFNWDIANKTQKNIFLSGGLSPKNVARAIRKVRPFAVDVSSGVEKKAGQKDKKLIKDFIMNVKKADSFVCKRKKSKGENA